MKEHKTTDTNFKTEKSFYKYLLTGSFFFLGFIVAYLFLPPEQKVLEIPVEKVKYVDRVVEKRVEVPVEKIKYVDRVVEKKVEVPVEVVKYVDRVVENKVEVPVIQYVDRVIEKQAEPVSSNKQNWRRLQKGMTMLQVSRLLGSPTKVNSYSSSTDWKYPNWGEVTFMKKINYSSYQNDEEFVSGWSEPNN